MVSSSSLDNQFLTLQKISENIASLIKEDFVKVSHLDKIRKKILSDIKKKDLIINNNKNSLLKLISKNDELICEIENKKKVLSKEFNQNEMSKNMAGTYNKVLTYLIGSRRSFG